MKSCNQCSGIIVEDSDYVNGVATVAGKVCRCTALKATSAEPVALAALWRNKAIELREESGRIRRTIKQSTGAEERCNVRAEIYDKCADELDNTAPPAAQLKAAQVASKVKYDEFMAGEDDSNPLENLRFFLSIALHNQDWLDVEPFLDALPDTKAAQREVLEKAKNIALAIDSNRGNEKEIANAIQRMIDELS